MTDKKRSLPFSSLTCDSAAKHFSVPAQPKSRKHNAAKICKTKITRNSTSRAETHLQRVYHRLGLPVVQAFRHDDVSAVVRVERLHAFGVVDEFVDAAETFVLDLVVLVIVAARERSLI